MEYTREVAEFNLRTRMINLLKDISCLTDDAIKKFDINSLSRSTTNPIFNAYIDFLNSNAHLMNYRPVEILTTDYPSWGGLQNSEQIVQVYPDGGGSTRNLKDAVTATLSIHITKNEETNELCGVLKFNTSFLLGRGKNCNFILHPKVETF